MSKKVKRNHFEYNLPHPPANYNLNVLQEGDTIMIDLELKKIYIARRF